MVDLLILHQVQRSTHPSSFYGGERYTDSTLGKHAWRRGKKTTFLDSPRLHQNWLLRLLCPKNLDTRVKKNPTRGFLTRASGLFGNDPASKHPSPATLLFSLGAFTEQLVVLWQSMRMVSYSLKIYHYPWLRLISWVTKSNNIEMTTR